MNDAMITLVGNVVDEPRLRRTANGHDVANFRIASTSRRYDREQARFVDNATLFVTVTCWRQFGVNVSRSVHKGQPVVVYGRFCMREYTVDEQPRTSYELEATSVGHDLARGTTTFTRVTPTQSPRHGCHRRGGPAGRRQRLLGGSRAGGRGHRGPAGCRRGT